jgi:hypothetical protein
VLFLILLTVFNFWHSFDRGVWDPPSAIDSLGLNEARAKRLHAIDPALRPARHAFDGQYFYVMTYDPLLISRKWSTLLDEPAYRYRRMLYPLTANVLALNRPRLFPGTLLLVNVLFFLGGAIVAGRLARPTGWSTGACLAYLGTTGLVFCAFRTLPEPMSLGLCLIGLACLRQNRRTAAALAFAAAALVREWYVLVALSVAAWEALYERRSLKNSLALVAPALLALAIWSAYVAWRLAPLPPAELAEANPWRSTPSPGLGHFTLPFVGMVFETRQGLDELTTRTETRRTISLVIAAATVMVIVVIAFLRRPSFWGFLCVVQAAFVSVVRGDIWNFHPGSSRLLIPLFVFSSIWCASESARPQSPPPRDAAGLSVR